VNKDKWLIEANRHKGHKMSEEKTKKENLANRRAVAVLIELCAIKLLIVIVALMKGEFASIPPGVGFAWGYLYFRDLLGTANLSKRMVGLRLVSEDGGKVSTSAKIKRNFFLGLLFWYEYAALTYTDKNVRFGDEWAKTRVVDMAPDTKGRGSWRIQLLVGLAVFFALSLI
jgi:uncharacterized RDD family membrane protein YckC